MSYSRFARLSVLCFMVVSACATIVEGTDQTVQVQLSPRHAFCNVKRESSVIATVNGGSNTITIPKSKNDLFFDCKAQGYTPKTVKIESSASGWGVVGCIFIDLCITDYSTGALNKYPKVINISLPRADISPQPDYPPAARY